MREETVAVILENPVPKVLLCLTGQCIQYISVTGIPVVVSVDDYINVC